MKQLRLIAATCALLLGACSQDKAPAPGASPDMAAARQQEIQRLTAVVRRGGGDAILGKQVFQARCAPCHKLFGQGGDVGPDLTPYLRRDEYLDFLLTSIVDPGERIHEYHTTHIVTTTGGATYVGVVLDDRGDQVVLAVPGGNQVTIAKREIETMQAKLSTVMPEHMLSNLSEDQVRNLFAYIMREAPVRK